MKRPTRRLGAALLAAAVTLAPAALANGRFPRAERLIEHPSDPNQLVLGATYGLLVTRDRGANWHFVCEASFAHDPSYMGDPLLDYLGDGSLIVGVQTSMSVSSDQACDWIPTLREADAFIVDHAVAKSNRSTVVAAAAVSTGGMVKSTLRESLDGGRTWTAIGSPLPVGSLLSIDIDPTDPRRFFATGLDGEMGRFLVSADHGATWSVHPLPTMSSGDAPYIAGILPTDSNRIFVRTDAPGQVAETGDALLFSDDGGVSWREVHRSRARLLGFALSPDASTVLVGYGDPGPGGVAPLPGTLGIFRSSTSQFSFERVYDGPVNCLTWTTTGIYACANETRDGFELAFSPNSDLRSDAGCLVPILHRDQVRGPLDCAPATSGAACAADWPTSCLRLGACSSDAGAHASGCVPAVPPPMDSGAAGAGGMSDVDASMPAGPNASGCSCRASALDASGAGGFALGLMLVLASRRRARHSIATSSSS